MQPVQPQHQQEIQQLRNHRGNGSTLCSHGYKAKFTEYQDIVQHCICQSRCNAGIQRIAGLFHTPEQGRQQCRTRHGKKGSGEDAQILCCRCPGCRIRSIQSHDLLRQQYAAQSKDTGKHKGKEQIQIIAPLYLSPVFLSQILRDHNTGHRSKGRHHDTVYPGKFACQPYASHIDTSQLSNHDLIHDAEGGLQHGLQGYGNRQIADVSEKAVISSHRNPSKIGMAPL